MTCAGYDDDEESLLIERVQVGDHGAFDALFHRYLSTVYRQAIRLLGDQAEAEEVVQEVFLTVYEKAQTFRGHSAFSTQTGEVFGLSARTAATVW